MPKPKSNAADNLDFGTFSDIITNVLGILIFMGVMFTLTMSGAKFIVRTPKNKATTKKPVFFECRSGQIYFVDKDSIWNDLDRKVARLLKNSPDMVMGEIATQLSDEKIGNTYYLLDINKFFRENMISLVPRDGVKGESINDLKKADSLFKEIINNLVKDDDFVYMFVKPDSFEVFRIARAYLWDMDIQVGWYPLNFGRNPTFGSSGRRPKMS